MVLLEILYKYLYMITFKQYLIEKLDLPEIVIDPAVKHNQRMVILDVDKFDSMWKTDPDFYVGPGGTGSAIAGRYDRFKEFLKNGDGYGPVPIFASQSYVRKDGVVGFNNGRHRFAVLRDMGIKKIPVSMGSESIRNARLLGLID